MGNNTQLNVGSGGDVVRLQERTAAKTQIVGFDFAIADSTELILGAPSTLRATYSSAQTDQSILGAISSTQKVVVMGIDVAVGNLLTTSPSVLIGFNTTTTPTTSGVVFAHPGVASANFYSKGGNHAPIAVGAADEELRITTGTITSDSIDVVVTYYVVAL